MNNSFWLILLKGTLHSLILGAEAIAIYIPLALLIAVIFKSKKTGAFLYLLDVLISLPHQLILITLAALLGGSPLALLLSVGITQLPGIIRHLHVYVVRAFQNDSVEAARALGVPPLRLVIFHILPRLSGALSIISISLLKRVILSEALLTFLGLGFDPLTPSLGRLLSEGRSYLFYEPMRFIAPMCVLFLLLFLLQNLTDRISYLFRPQGVRYL